MLVALTRAKKVGVENGSRARTQLEVVRAQFPWLTPESTVVVVNQEGGTVWWTFTGQNANAAIGPAMDNRPQVQTMSDNLMIEFERAIEALWSCDHDELLPMVDPLALEGLKFSDCLPPELGIHVLAVRARDRVAVDHIFGTRVRVVSG